MCAKGTARRGSSWDAQEGRGPGHRLSVPAVMAASSELRAGSGCLNPNVGVAPCTPGGRLRQHSPPPGGGGGEGCASARGHCRPARAGPRVARRTPAPSGSGPVRSAAGCARRPACARACANVSHCPGTMYSVRARPPVFTGSPRRSPGCPCGSGGLALLSPARERPSGAGSWHQGHVGFFFFFLSF